MTFASATARRDGLMLTRFGELANIYRARDKNLTGITVLVDRNVGVPSDNGLTVVKRTILSFRKDQLLSGTQQVQLDEGDQVEMLAEQADGSYKRTGECFYLRHVMTEDAGIVQWYVR